MSTWYLSLFQPPPECSFVKIISVTGNGRILIGIPQMLALLSKSSNASAIFSWPVKAILLIPWADLLGHHPKSSLVSLPHLLSYSVLSPRVLVSSTRLRGSVSGSVVLTTVHFLLGIGVALAEAAGLIGSEQLDCHEILRDWYASGVSVITSLNEAMAIHRPITSISYFDMPLVGP
ncbi:hypothetical protein CROQUDRAFT_95316 [Cronartium quercuum f. sp. fusiforme G11]|uniref:Uncharacterized protein n=1 Tax=Cronartium quercuum f. sp. fusiforme G11 TaxID=708437 RepID=A0A9P6NCK0_9BASI|nr:hypothetical protein CROQUDRAFT_95316 [Cronartium quercuum f. sp. fusiforme G11]